MIQTTVFYSYATCLKDALHDLMNYYEESFTGQNVLSVTLFSRPWLDSYDTHLKELKDYLHNYFPSHQLPMSTYVAQPSLQGNYAFELHSLNQEAKVTFTQTAMGMHYATIIWGTTVFYLLEGQVGADAMHRCAEFMQVKGLTPADIIRQWNYIGQITGYTDGMQHYQVFNDARSEFYADVVWHHGYPAATGIGTLLPGYVISFLLAVPSDEATIRAIDNPDQIAAHVYTQAVLEGSQQLTTPKFERAKFVQIGDKAVCFVSGTAAICGEETVAVDVLQQAKQTVAHLYTLLDQCPCALSYTSLRVYLKYAHDVESVRDYLQTVFPNLPIVYLWGDVCRDALLIEIEGIAQ